MQRRLAGSQLGRLLSDRHRETVPNSTGWLTQQEKQKRRTRDTIAHCATDQVRRGSPHDRWHPDMVLTASRLVWKDIVCCTMAWFFLEQYEKKKKKSRVHTTEILANDHRLSIFSISGRDEGGGDVDGCGMSVIDVPNAVAASSDRVKGS